MIKNRKLQLIVAVILLIGIFLPMDWVRAVITIPNPTDWAAGLSIWISEKIVEILGKSISAFAKIFDAFIRNQPVEGVLVVDASWKIIRDFVNMFFILVLIIMAFGTIFNVKSYTYKDMLANLIIAALLVNFSLAIGKYIIGLANGLSHVFLSQMQEVSAHFAQGSGMVGLVSERAKQIGALDAASDVFITAVFSVVFLIMVFIAMASAAIFSIARLLILWFLLILSPIAWLGYSFPKIREGTWKRWWNEFLCWSFFLPYYLFFLMFGVMFIKQKSALANILPAGTNTGGLFGGSFQTLNDFLFYCLSIIFLIGGLAIARQLACASGGKISEYMGKIEGGVKKYIPGSRYVRSVYTGTREGARAGVERIRERGVPFVIASEREERLRQARIAERFGQKGAREEAMNKEMGTFRGKLERITDENELRKLSRSGPLPQQFAALEVLKERGALNAQELVNTYNLYQREAGALSALKFARGINFDKMSGGERQTLFNGIIDPEVRRKILSVMAEKSDIRRDRARGETDEEFLQRLRNYLTLFPQEGDRREFLRKQRKQTFEAALRLQAELGLIRDAAGNPVRDFEQALEEEVRKMKLDEILELSRPNLELLTRPGSNTRRTIGAKLQSPEQIAAIPGKVTAEQLNALDDLIVERRAELERETLRRQEQQAQVQARAQVEAQGEQAQTQAEAQRTQAETQLRAQAELFQGLVDSINDLSSILRDLRNRR